MRQFVSFQPETYAEVVQIFLRDHRNILMKIVCLSIQTFCWKNFLKKNVSFFSRTFSGEISSFCPKNFSAEFSKLHPTCRQSTWRKSSFSGKKIFFPSSLDTEWKDCGLIWKKFRHARQNCIIRVHRNKFKDGIFPEKKLFSILSRQWGKTFQPFTGKISAGLSKQYFACPSKHFDGIFSQKVNFVLFSTFSDKLWPFVEIFSADSSKLHPTCPCERFEEN